MSKKQHSYTPKEIHYLTGIGYRKILRDIEKEILPAKKDGLSYSILEDNLANYLAGLGKDFSKGLIISFKGNIPKDKIKGVTEDLVDTFNKVNDKHKIHLSLNIENE